MINVIKNNEKGVTLLAVMLVIVIMTILATITIKNIDTGKDIKEYNNMCADIELLESKILVYYNDNKTLPVKGALITDAQSRLGNQQDERDNMEYYQIDIDKLSNVTLNYGGGSVEDNDIYIINVQSHEIYYFRGVLLKGTVYHKKR